ncbi:H/ACA ribonucleoprotein complex subunit 2 [Nematocida sp. ERTm5]|nr:H/ACA ribonucleoprotein complex subunit 2 [Nematocida sp. AWRm79]KAI5183002.1 H/ACA ribonucleoprotein complex subunit 2 [Nematocida sp. AWRm78]OAG29787.1 H/ACA ribonucleoprotein complex subunit 2 [Nematocida sp. ERTm5]
MPAPISRTILSAEAMGALPNIMKRPECKRGIKAVQKSLLKKDDGIVVLAADVAPFDLVSHIPALCSDSNVPLLYINSRFDVKTDKDKPTTCLFIPLSILSNEEALLLQ